MLIIDYRKSTTTELSALHINSVEMKSLLMLEVLGDATEFLSQSLNMPCMAKKPEEWLFFPEEVNQDNTPPSGLFLSEHCGKASSE